MDVLKTFVGKDERKNKKIAKISLKKIKIIVEAK